jgi:hypothetical protein
MIHSLYGSDRNRKKPAQIKQDTRSIGCNSPFFSIRPGRPGEFWIGWLDEVRSFLSRYLENLGVSIYLIIEDEEDGVKLAELLSCESILLCGNLSSSNSQIHPD